jgi:hypothetical protein
MSAVRITVLHACWLGRRLLEVGEHGVSALEAGQITATHRAELADLKDAPRVRDALAAESVRAAAAALKAPPGQRWRDDPRWR